MFRIWILFYQLVVIFSIDNSQTSVLVKYQSGGMKSMNYLHAMG